MDNTAKNKLAAAVAQQWPAASAGHFAVEAALSGGLDSVVLLHLLASLRTTQTLQLSAVHVHHGLSPHADAWADFCRRLCRQWHIPLRIENVQVAPSGLGLEAAARQARYRCLENSPAPLVALAHHGDDQIETFLLAAGRGGGLRALAAMPPVRPLNPHIRLWRPLLPFSRRELQDYAYAHRLSWIEDDSNRDTRLLRNWLRLQALPACQARLPHFNRQLTATIGQLQRDLALLEEYIAEDRRRIHDPDDRFRISLWRQLSPRRQTQQLHDFARRHRLGNPGAASVQAFATTLAQTRTSHAHWSLPNGTAVYAGDTLLILEPLQALLQQVLNGERLPDWQPDSYGLPAHSVEPAHGYWRPALPHDTLPLAGGGRKTLRRLLQEHHIPPALRDGWPVWADRHSHQCLAALNLPIRTALALPGGLSSQLPELSRQLPPASNPSQP